MTTTFPFGYGDTQLSWEEMLTKTTVNRLHPEVLRRYGGLIHAAAAVGVPLGVGTGWRVQPNPPPAGFAKPGNSWHESCPVSPTSATALAIDTVPNSSWDWMHVHCGQFGLRHFKYVGSEPWHVQPAEISTSRKFATTLPPLVTWELPGVPPPIPPTPTPVPPTTGGTFVIDVTKNELTDAKRAQLKGNGDVYLIQQIAQGHFKQLGTPAFDCGKPDGDYGPRTQTAVREIQRIAGLTVDGECGNQTWTHVLNKKGT